MDVEATVFLYELHNQPGDNFVKEVFSLDVLDLSNV